MKTFHDCLPCFVTQSLEWLRRCGTSPSIIDETMREVFEKLAIIDYDAPPPVLAGEIYRTIRRKTGRSDPYVEEKKRFNIFACNLLSAMRGSVEQAENRILTGVKLAIAANIIDFGKYGKLSEEDVQLCFDRALSEELDLAALGRLEQAVREAKLILYLCDNAGEIIFDRFFIESLPTEKLICAVRGAPVINDATWEDALWAKLPDIVPVITNGHDAPGTVIDKCSEGFRKTFDEADLIIAKGQGNFETLSETRGKRIFFLLQVKCPVIARDAGYPHGSFVVKEHYLCQAAENKYR
ncbi:MAG: damage-control phosphatase ARMT1 family protein [Chitinispirillaceae bacterium]